jgi:hypothetical protein
MGQHNRLPAAIVGLVCIVGSPALVRIAISARAALLGQSVGAMAQPASDVTVYAAGRGAPTINLQDGKEIPTVYTGPAGLVAALEHNQAESLALASYTATVTDANGCTATACFTVTVCN